MSPRPNSEQSEAKGLAAMKQKYPRLHWLGTWSRVEKRLRLWKYSFVRGLGPGYGAPENYSGALSVGLEWKLPDLWIGAFWKGDRDEWFLWICLLPCLPIRFHYRRAYGGWIT